LVEDFGWNWSDYGARWYDPAIGKVMKKTIIIFWAFYFLGSCNHHHQVDQKAVNKIDTVDTILEKSMPARAEAPLLSTRFILKRRCSLQPLGLHTG